MLEAITYLKSIATILLFFVLNIFILMGLEVTAAFTERENKSQWLKKPTHTLAERNIPVQATVFPNTCVVYTQSKI